MSTYNPQRPTPRLRWLRARIAALGKPAILLLGIGTSIATSPEEPFTRSSRDVGSVALGSSRHVVVTLSQSMRNEAFEVIISFTVGKDAAETQVQVEPDKPGWPVVVRTLVPPATPGARGELDIDAPEVGSSLPADAGSPEEVPTVFLQYNLRSVACDPETAASHPKYCADWHQLGAQCADHGPCRLGFTLTVLNTESTLDTEFNFGAAALRYDETEWGLKCTAQTDFTDKATIEAKFDE